MIDRLTDRSRTFTEYDAAEIMKKVMRAINHCHSNKLVHRDIKPENIMFTAGGEVKLIDFDFA